MKSIKYFFTAAITVAFAFAACTKEADAPEQNKEGISREYGKPIIFGVSTSHESGPATKVKYSGNIVGGKERIDWEANDEIKIFCLEASDPLDKSAAYRVTGVTVPDANEAVSSASLQAADGSGLKWGDSAMHKFYAISPNENSGSPLPNHNKILSSNLIRGGRGLNVKVEIPENQNPGGEPVMTAFVSANKNEASSSPVAMNFTPALNTFDIKIINARTGNVNLQSLELFSPLENISGQYNIKISDSGERTYDFQNKNSFQYKKVAHIYQNGYSMEPNGVSHIRLYTFPVDIKHLVLILNFENETINLELKDDSGNWIMFEKEKKYDFINIKIPESVEDFNYVFNVANPDTLFFRPFNLVYPPVSMSKPLDQAEVKVKSYRYNDNKNLGVQWGYSGSYPWVNYSGSENIYSGLPADEEQKLEIKIDRSIKGELRNPQEDRAYSNKVLAMRNHPNGPAANEDLSKGKLGAGEVNTANSYIVYRVGSYRFPLVYGNAIKNGSTNSEAYTPLPRPEDVAEDKWLSNFVDGTGAAITSPYFTAATVNILWMSAPDLINSVELVSEENGRQFVQFVTGTQITFGNAVIAVKNASGVIIWTWHIWFTDLGFDNNAGEFLDEPLGHLPKPGGGYKEIIKDMELTQLDAKGQSKSILIKVKSAYSYKTCLYFTPGRMTPLVHTKRGYYKASGDINQATIAECYKSSNISDEFRFQFENDKNNIWQAVSSPGKICQLIEQPINIWNRNPRGVAGKTVYDPSPAGYRVPTMAELAGASIDNHLTGKISECSYVGNELTISVADYAKKAYFLHSGLGFRSFPQQEEDAAQSFIYMPILPIRE